MTAVTIEFFYDELFNLTRYNFTFGKNFPTGIKIITARIQGDKRMNGNYTG